MSPHIKSAYHQIKIDEPTALLRLFLFFKDVPKCNQPRIFKRICQEFGDSAAAFGLEIACLKFVMVECVMEISKFIVESVCYADNINTSFQTIYKNMLQDEQRAPEEIEKCLGLQ